MAPWAAAVEALGSLDVDAIATIGMHLDPSVLLDVPPTFVSSDSYRSA